MSPGGQQINGIESEFPLRKKKDKLFEAWGYLISSHPEKTFPDGN
jgi:hypothetical protein